MSGEGKEDRKGKRKDEEEERGRERETWKSVIVAYPVAQHAAAVNVAPAWPFGPILGRPAPAAKSEVRGAHATSEGGRRITGLDAWPFSPSSSVRFCFSHCFSEPAHRL